MTSEEEGGGQEQEPTVKEWKLFWDTSEITPLQSSEEQKEGRILTT